MSGDPESGLAAIIGGADVEVTYRDGNRERVRINVPDVSKFETYISVMEDEGKSLELLCDRQPGWAATLTPESHDELIEKGQGLALPLLQRWHRRRMARMEVLNPGFSQRLEEQIARAASEARVIPAGSASGSMSSAGSSPRVTG